MLDETRLPLMLVLASALVSCSDDPELGAPITSDGGAIQTPPNNTCEGARDGTSCGKDKHCIAQRCFHNTCGDGIRAGREQCDDGNEAVGDGCDPACRNESGTRPPPDSPAAPPSAPPGIEVFCGNGFVEAGEQCDDGNRVSGDGCSMDCKLEGDASVLDAGVAAPDAGSAEACGNGIVDLDEQCDDGNLVAGDGCADCQLAGPCRQCLEQATLLAGDEPGSRFRGCYLTQDVITEGPAGSLPVAFVCARLLQCVRKAQCAEGSVLYPCYCGTASIDDCQMGKAQPDGPCRQDYEAGAETTDPLQIAMRAKNKRYALGRASQLFLSQHINCATQCQWAPAGPGP